MISKPWKPKQGLLLDYPKGCTPPEDYVAWFDWARAQNEHGLRQKLCKQCRQYLFPQEVKTHQCK